MIRSKKGISLISLIITIIVIIILATMVIFNGFGTTDSAQFAKFSQEYSSYVGVSGDCCKYSQTGFYDIDPGFSI